MLLIGQALLGKSWKFNCVCGNNAGEGLMPINLGENCIKSQSDVYMNIIVCILSNCTLHMRRRQRMTQLATAECGFFCQWRWKVTAPQMLG